MKEVVLFIYLFSFVFFFACKNKEKKACLPFVDFDKEYEYKEIPLQEIARVKYIRFETDTDCLLNAWLPNYISKDYIIFMRNDPGSILFFNHQGQHVHTLNRKGMGPEEYMKVGQIVWDEQAKELYCFAHFDNVIKVYRLDGSYVRTLPSKDNGIIEVMYNYNDSLLICWNNNIKGSSDYYFLSKFDTLQFHDLLTIPFEKRQTRDLVEYSQSSAVSVEAPLALLLFQGDEYKIADPSLDTIYRLTSRRTLEPIFTRTPSITDQHPPVALDYGPECKDYIFMTSVEMHYDFQANQGLKKVSYALEKKTGKMYRTHVYNLDYPDDPDYYFMAYQLVSGYLVQYYPAEQLMEAREKKKLSGELDKIASTLQEEDNGVLMIIDFPSAKVGI